MSSAAHHISNAAHHISNTAHAAGTAAFHALPDHVQNNIKVGTHDIKQGVHNAHKMVSKAAHTAYKVSKQIAYDIAIGVFVLLLVILIIVLFSVSFQKSITKNNLTVNENLTVTGNTTIAKNLTVSGTFTSANTVNATTTNYDLISCDGITIDGTATSTSTPSVGLSCTSAGVLSVNSGTSSGGGAIDCSTITAAGNIQTSKNIITPCVGLYSGITSTYINLICPSSNTLDIGDNGGNGIINCDTINCNAIGIDGSLSLVNSASNSVELSCTADGVVSTEGIICTNINASSNVSAQSITVTGSTANAALMQLGSNTTDNYVNFSYSSSGILLISPVTGTSSTTLVTGAVEIAGDLNVGSGANTCSIYSTAFNSLSFGGTASATLYCGDLDCADIKCDSINVTSEIVSPAITITSSTPGTIMQISANTSNDYANFSILNNILSINFAAAGSLSIGGNIYGKTIYSNNQALSTSDYRLKEEIEPISDEYSIDKLKPCSYLLKADESKTLQTGFIAHELQEIFPHLVKGEKDAEEMQYVNYIGLIAILTKELQSLKTIVTELKADNIELKADNVELKADNIELKSRIIKLETH